VPRSVIDAVRQGDWDFEPTTEAAVQVQATGAMPGTSEKLDILADRLRRGLPLWHPGDRRSFDDREEA
jgi:hypothetical protein